MVGEEGRVGTRGGKGTGCFDNCDVVARRSGMVLGSAVSNCPQPPNLQHATPPEMMRCGVALGKLGFGDGFGYVIRIGELQRIDWR
jgi:hypothetical protein